MTTSETEAADLPLSPLPCVGSARPRLFVTAEPTDGLHSLAQMRAGIQSGHAQALWRELKSKVAQESEQDAWTPRTPLPIRQPGPIKHANREYILVAATASRIQDAALVALIEDDRQSVDAALRQAESVFDDQQWPKIEDITHLRHGDHCSLRRGQLAFAMGLAYDWMHALMSEQEQRWYIEQFDRRFTQAFQAGLEAPDRFTRMNNNFVAAIYGGFGVAALAFGEDYERTDWLIEQTAPPADRLPLGRAYHHFAKGVSSRSSWDPQCATSAVYAKAGREPSHGHADWGQVCIDGFGERLIVDLGSTPGNPPGKAGRFKHLKAS